jgi:hypothetical protein
MDERRDQCVVMPTGYGKSLCYQFQPVFQVNSKMEPIILQAQIYVKAPMN